MSDIKMIENIAREMVGAEAVSPQDGMNGQQHGFVRFPVEFLANNPTKSNKSIQIHPFVGI